MPINISEYEAEVRRINAAQTMLDARKNALEGQKAEAVYVLEEKLVKNIEAVHGTNSTNKNPNTGRYMFINVHEPQGAFVYRGTVTQYVRHAIANCDIHPLDGIRVILDIIDMKDADPENPFGAK